MKRTLLILLCLSETTAFAQTYPGDPLPPALAGLAHSDYGCEVLLCLADPRGPKTEAACVPPISRLEWDLAHGRPIPPCNQANGPGGRSYAALSTHPYDPCPAGTQELPAGQYAALARLAFWQQAQPSTPLPAPSRYAGGDSGVIYTGIGDGSASGTTLFGGSTNTKVCVAGSQGSSGYVVGESTYVIGLYDTIYVENPSPFGQALDVYIDNRLWQTVRLFTPATP
jgi:hypothetical protein